MTIGNSGNESWQHVPDFPASRIQIDKSLGGYTKSNQYDSSVPATKHHQDMWNGNFSMDLSQGKFNLFLKSPRHFWMQYNGPFEASHSSASFTVNERVGTLAESTTDAIRASGSGATVASIPFFSGTMLQNMHPFVHPSRPDFTSEFMGREWPGFTQARTHGVLYGRTGIDPHPRFNVYGIPDDLLEYEDSEGQKWIVIIDYKTTSVKDWSKKVNDWFDPRKDIYHRSYIVQLEFYAWLMEQIIQRDGLPHRVSPIGHHIGFNVGHNGQADLMNSQMSLELESAHIPLELDWSWIQPTIDLAIECVLAPNPPVRQGLPGPPKEKGGKPSTAAPKFHNFDVSDERYVWLMKNHPGSWP